MLLRTLFVTIAITWTGLVHAENSIFPGQFDLLQFKIKNIPSDNNGTVSCDPKMVKKAMVDHTWIREGRRPGRSLEVSMQPLERKASWIFLQKDCPSLKPYFNGLGFRRIEESGRATLYLAAFDKIAPGKNKTGISLAVDILAPQFRARNMVEFEAECAYVNKEQIVEKTTTVPFLKFFSKTEVTTETLTHTTRNLRCALANDQGFVDLVRRRTPLDGAHAIEGSKVIFSPNVLPSLAVVTHIVPDDQILKTTHSQSRYVKFSEVEIYEPMETVMTESGAFLEREDRVLKPRKDSKGSYSVGEVTDIANDMVQISGAYFFAPDKMVLYSPQKEVEIADGSVVQSGDTVVMLGIGSPGNLKILDIANGMIQVDHGFDPFYPADRFISAD